MRGVQSESGRGLISSAIWIALLGVVIYAASQIFPVYLTYYRFKDAMQETAQSSLGKSERQVIDQVLEKAAELKVPVTEPQILFRRDPDRAYLTAEYEVDLSLVPAYNVRWKFTPKAEAFLYKPAAR